MKRHNKSSLFLMELILSILLFSLCSAVCVQLFVAAYQKEQDAQALTWAAMLCDSVAAQIRTGEKDFDFYVTSYDSSFRPCEDEENPAWRLNVVSGTADDGQTRIARLFVYPCSQSPASLPPEDAAIYEICVAY